MKKLLFVVLILVAISSVGFAESGVGVHAYYPLFGMGLKPIDQFAIDDFSFGFDFRNKMSLFLIDFSAEVPLNLFYVATHFDAGICFDIAILRLGVLGGISAGYNFFDESFIWAPNVKANVDFKLGPITIGMAGIFNIPIDAASGSVAFYYHSGVSINILYWFGDKKD